MATKRGHPVALEAAEYWLRHCEGFRVEAPRGRVGVVEAVVSGVESDAPDAPGALVVRVDLFGTRRVVVPAGEVAAVRPREQRLDLRSSPAGRPAARSTEGLRHLKHLLRASDGDPVG